MHCPKPSRKSAIVSLSIAAAPMLLSSSHLFAAAGSNDEATLPLPLGMFER
jgi:hypothetical protein